MAKRLIISFTIALLSVGCEKYHVDPDYPTTYNILTRETLTQLKESFASRNIYLTSSVNKFGFCYFSEEPLEVPEPPLENVATKEEAIQIVKDFISVNPVETGVGDPDDLTFPIITSRDGTGEVIRWYLQSSHQVIGTIEVLNTSIMFHIKNSEVVACMLNWYPYIYIPESFNINETQAKISLIGKTVTHHDISGEEYYVTITEADVVNSTASLKILPLTSDEIIELRVVWEINLSEPVFCHIYFDVMTGEIVMQIPTVIS